jgi:hypothetical protein
MKVNVGDSVMVSDPQDKDSTHEHTFLGTVISVDNLCADVIDQDGEVWSVSLDEIIISAKDKTITETRKPDYLTNCSWVTDRLKDDKKLEKMKKKFVFFLEGNRIDTNGTLNIFFQFNKDRKIEFQKDFRVNPNLYGFYQAIPSALLLYRLGCVFDGEVHFDREGYKCIWEFPLKHKKTGEIVIFGEHKGGSSFWTRFVNVKDVPKEFLKDLKELVEYLVSDEVTHPYDGVLAGSVA